MKKYSILLAATLALALCAGCVKETAGEVPGVLLEVESIGGDAKVFVDGTQTYWNHTSDRVNINGQSCAVRRTQVGSEWKYYAADIPNVPAGGRHFAYYPASYCPQAVDGRTYAEPDHWWDEDIDAGRAFSFTLNRRNVYIKANNRQSLDKLPLVAVAASDGGGRPPALLFRHLAAVVQVDIVNPMSRTLYIDSVVVEAATSALHGTCTFTLDPATGEPTVAGPGPGGSYGARSVCLKYASPSDWRVHPNSRCSVQLPVPPLPAGEALTVRVYGVLAEPIENGTSTYYYAGRHFNTFVLYRAHGDVDKFTFERTATLQQPLGRKGLLHATAKIRPDGHLVDEAGSIAQFSLFSLSATKQVLFPGVNNFIQHLNSDVSESISRAEIDYLLHGRPQTARFLCSIVDGEFNLVIFPDGTTAESVVAALSLADATHLNIPDEPTQLTISDTYSLGCANVPFPQIISGTNGHYVNLSDGYLNAGGYTYDTIPNHGGEMTFTYSDLKVVPLIGGN